MIPTIARLSSRFGINQLRMKNGWILGPGIDFCAFFLPFLIVFSVFSLNPSFGSEFFTFASVFFIKNTIDMAHDLSTAFLAIQRVRENRISKIFLYTSPVVVFSMMLFVSRFFSPSMLVYVMAYLSLLHIYWQQHRWVMISRRAAREFQQLRWLDILMVINIVQYPLIYWHSPYSKIELASLNPNDLVLRTSALVTDISYSLHWSFNLFYIVMTLAFAAHTKKINLGKLALILSTWLMFYGSHVIMNNLIFWVYVGPMTHGIPYLIIAYRESKRNTKKHRASPKGKGSKVFLGHTIAFPLLLIAATMYWDYGPSLNTMLPESVMEWLPQIFWLPTMLHYYLDTVIWRQNKCEAPVQPKMATKITE